MHWLPHICEEANEYDAAHPELILKSPEAVSQIGYATSQSKPETPDAPMLEGEGGEEEQGGGDDDLPDDNAENDENGDEIVAEALTEYGLNQQTIDRDDQHGEGDDSVMRVWVKRQQKKEKFSAGHQAISVTGQVLLPNTICADCLSSDVH
eukprot:s1418_g8.t1